MIPTDFNADKASTATLTDLHQKLDMAIAGKRGHTLGHLSQGQAKTAKCTIKTVLVKRARAGDAVADSYSKQRRWSSQSDVTPIVAE